LIAKVEEREEERSGQPRHQNQKKNFIRETTKRMS
jgi:hypothetical protein